MPALAPSPLLGQESITTVAVRAEMTRSHLSRAIRGERRLSLPAAYRLAGALGITMDELYRRLERMAKARVARTVGKAARAARVKRGSTR